MNKETEEKLKQRKVKNVRYLPQICFSSDRIEEFENLKKVVIGKNVKFEDSKQDFSKENSSKVNSYAEQMAARIKNKI